MSSASYAVAPIARADYLPFLLYVHYARSVPSVSYAWGLFCQGLLVGVVTYGTPPTAPARNGIAGKENAHRVLELNRLCLVFNKPNEASRLVGASLKMLPPGKIIISYADTSQGHSGGVYRACNFTYHGLSAKRTDWKIKGREHMHNQTIVDEFRGQKNRAALVREKYGDDFQLVARPRKHR